LKKKKNKPAQDGSCIVAKPEEKKELGDSC